MGRTLLIEQDLQDQITQLLGNQKFQQVGLIVGQLSQSRDYAIHLARCPDPVDDEVEVEISSSDDDVAVKKQNGRRKASVKKSPTVDSEVDSKWIVEHARQVNRMLTGGMNVLGVYMLSTPEAFTKSQTKLKQCLMSIHKRIENSKTLGKHLIHNEKYMLHICTSSRKITCRTVDTNNEQATIKPAEFRIQTFLNNWRCVVSCIDINILCNVPFCEEVSRTEQKIVHACQGEIDNIWNSYATVGYKLIDENQPLDGNKSKIKNSAGEEINICLFKDANIHTNEVSVENNSVTAQVKFVGSMLAKAFLHPKATYGDAVKSLKIDIIRSLLTRIALLCEEAEVNNLCHVDEWSLMSPARVFGPFKNYNLYFCDYIFKDECEGDSLGRFTELLNLKLPEEKLLFLEHSPDASVVSMMLLGDKNIDHLSDVASEISTPCYEGSRNKNLVVAGVAVFTAIIAVAVHFLSS